MSFNVFDGVAGNAGLKERLEANPLYHYAAKYWGSHTSEAPAENDRILEFLRNQVKISTATEAMGALYDGSRDLSQKTSDQMTGTHVAAYFGLELAVIGLLEDKSGLGYVGDSKDGNGRTPLSWAAENGHEGVVKLLLNTATVDLEDKYGRTPLSYAAEKGHKAVVNLLLGTNRVNADLKENDLDIQPDILPWLEWDDRGIPTEPPLRGAKYDRPTPLSWAAKNGHEAVVILLLNTGKVNVDKRTPLL